MSDAPTPAEVDRKARDYHALKDALDRAMQAATEARVPLDVLTKELIETVNDFGSVHAEKSKLLHGITHEMMVTFGQSVSIDAAAVERFRVALAESDQSRLCKKVFNQTVRWSLRPDSGSIVRGAGISKSLLALYAQCEVIKSRAPSLQVRPAGA